MNAIFPRNESDPDRLVRVIPGTVLIAIIFVEPKTPLGWFGLIPLITGLVGSCPICRLFGISTCGTKK